VWNKEHLSSNLVHKLIEGTNVQPITDAKLLRNLY